MMGQTYASFGGSPIFGLAVVMKTVKNPSASQLNAFFGVNDQERLFGGTRGRVTLVEGLLNGSSASDLKYAELAFDQFDDGQAYQLVDTFGYTYSNVVFEAFEPTDRVIQDSGGQGYFRKYKAVFNHLSS